MWRSWNGSDERARTKVSDAPGTGHGRVEVLEAECRWLKSWFGGHAAAHTGNRQRGFKTCGGRAHRKGIVPTWPRAVKRGPRQIEAVGWRAGCQPGGHIG